MNRDRNTSVISREQDLLLLRRAIEISKLAREAGNHPFGALLADADGTILLEQGNIQTTEQDITGHAETTLARRAGKLFDKDFLWTCTLYTSCEPCCMCTGAVYWANIGRVVFAMTEEALYGETGENDENPTFKDLGCRDIFAKGQKPVEIIGPVPELLQEALAVHEGFWS